MKGKKIKNQQKKAKILFFEKERYLYLQFYFKKLFKLRKQPSWNGVLAGTGRVRAWGLGRPGVITSELRLARTKYIDLHGGWGAGPGDGAGETLSPRPGLPGGHGQGS